MPKKINMRITNHETSLRVERSKRITVTRQRQEYANDEYRISNIEGCHCEECNDEAKRIANGEKRKANSSRYVCIFYLFLLISFSGCVDKKLSAFSKGFSDGRYDSEFPSKNASTEIERITHSIKKLYCVSSYTTYQFKREAKITGYHIRQGTYKKAAWGVISTNETIFGTATILGVTNSRITLITCAHIIHSPDTLFSYYETTEEDPLFYIKSFSIKEKQENWVKDLSSCGSFPILAADFSSDIAFLGKKCETLMDTIVPFTYPSGKAKELEWGSFVYVLGYPLGNLVVTKGIVSLPPNRPSGDFTLDALLNKGCSGGIILAIRDGVPNFELVGIVKTVNSNQDQFLKPSEDDHRYTDYIPYKGDIYVGSSERIQYGLNSVVPIEIIQDFYQKNRMEFLKGGFDLDGFFRVKAP